MPRGMGVKFVLEVTAVEKEGSIPVHLDTPLIAAPTRGLTNTQQQTAMPGWSLIHAFQDIQILQIP